MLFRSIALHPQIGFPDFPSRNTKRLCFIFQAPPLTGWPNRCRSTTHTPFAPPAFTGFLATTECSAPWRRIRTLTLVVHATCGFSVSIGTEGSHVPNNRLTRAQATYMPDTVPSVNRSRRNSSRRLLTNRGFDIVSSFRNEKRWFTCVPLPGSRLTRYTSEPFPFSAHHHGF